MLKRVEKFLWGTFGVAFIGLIILLVVLVGELVGEGLRGLAGVLGVEENALFAGIAVTISLVMTVSIIVISFAERARERAKKSGRIR